jgi:hypothetical protein
MVDKEGTTGGLTRGQNPKTANLVDSFIVTQIPSDKEDTTEAKKSSAEVEIIACVVPVSFYEFPLVTAPSRATRQ